MGGVVGGLEDAVFSFAEAEELFDFGDEVGCGEVVACLGGGDGFAVFSVVAFGLYAWFASASAAVDGSCSALVVAGAWGDWLAGGAGFVACLVAAS